MIREGNISFEFVGNLIKYDETFFYRDHVNHCHETKAVDILALNNHPLYMVEIKDFRGYRIQNKARIKNADLAIEFAQKVRDTIAGLYGAFRKHNYELRIFHPYLFYNQNSPTAIKAILLLEEDNATNNVEAKKRSQLKREMITKIEQRLGFLSLHILVLSISELNSYPNWKVA